MHEATLILAILLTAGFVAAKIGQLFRLPSVTGYICAGLLLGPAGFGLLPLSILEGKLDHFTQMALMLIAFGIGEHLDLSRLRTAARAIIIIGILEIITTFLMVFAGFYLVVHFFNLEEAILASSLVIALLLGSISVATAPGTTLHVMQESRAAGPLTTTLAQLVAVNNGVSIMLFGFALAASRYLLNEPGTVSVALTLLRSLGEISLSLVLGIGTGMIIDAVVHRLKNQGEMLTIGLALLLLCGELARLLSLSPLLTGMAVGFTIVNRDRRDVRIFRLLNSFEPPIYVLFFTVAGAHLDLAHLATAGWLGGLYFLLRCAGKYCGATMGGHLACVQSAIRDNVGTGLIPQAGMAIGFTFLLSADPNFRDSGQIITSIVLIGVFLSELIGPVCTKRALARCGEAAPEPGPSRAAYDPLLPTSGGTEIRLVPWTWQKLSMPPSRAGSVIFGVSQKKTVRSLARLATLLAHYHQATPCALSVKPRQRNLPGDRIIDDRELFALAEEEVRALGYDLSCRTIEAENIAKGLLAGAEKYQARAIIMGYPLEHKESQYSQVVDLVAGQAECEIIVARFIGILHTERILVPIVHDWNMEVVESCLCSLVNVGRHRVTLLRLLPPDTSGSDLEDHEKKLHGWATRKNLPFVNCVTRKVDSRLEEIIEEARHHDLVIMATGENVKLRKVFFGSLADDVAEQCGRPTLIIHSRVHRQYPAPQEK